MTAPMAAPTAPDDVSPDDVTQQAREVAHGRWLEQVGSAGFVAKGLLWVVVGLLVASLSAGGGQASQQGAIRRIESLPFGAALLVALAVGLGGYALLRLVHVVTDPSGEEGWRSAVSRLTNVFRVAVYGGLCATTVMHLLGSGGSGGGSEQQLTRRALELPGGRVLVGIAALVVLGVAVHQGHRGWTRDFLDQLTDGGQRVRRAMTIAGVSGHLARAVLLGTVSVLLIRAALESDSSEAGGIGEAAGEIAGTPVGMLLLPVLGLGLVGYGLYVAGLARWGTARTAD